MSQTPDRFPGDREETGLILSSDSLSDAEGQVRYREGRFSLFDSAGEFDPRSGGGGVTEAQHRSLRQLAHFLGENSPGDGFAVGPYVSEVLPSGSAFPTSETWYTDSSKVAKICRWEGTYNANKTFSTETWIVYKADGVNQAASAFDTIAHSGVVETGRSRTVTVY